MTTHHDDTQRWSVGQVARRTGLTVRTLHHYAQIGLLRPKLRTGSNHRRYTLADLERLQRILILRQLGLSLAQIADALGQRADLLTLLEQQREQVRRRAEELRQQESRLELLVASLRQGQTASADDLFSLMEHMTMFERHYTKEQLEALEQRRQALGPEAIAQVEQEWPQLIAAMTAAMQAGTDPADAEVQRMAARWHALIEAFTGGDPGISRALQTLHEQEPSARQHGPDPALMAYVQRAWALSGVQWPPR